MRKILLLFITLSFLQLNGYSQPVVQSTYLDSFPKKTQKNTKLCWAASYEMVQNYANPKNQICQCVIVGNVLPGNCGNCSSKKCTCNSPILRNVYYSSLNINLLMSSNIKLSLANINTILNEKSLIVGEGYDGLNEDHYLAGYGTEVVGENEFILVNDPYQGTNFSLIGKNVVELRYNLPNKDIETIVSIGEIQDSKKNTVVSNTFKKIADANLLSLSEQEKIKLCSLPDNKCYNHNYNYIYKQGIARIVTDVFELYSAKSAFSTKFKKINEKWEPMVIYGLKDTFDNLQFTITGIMPDGKIVKITKKKDSKDIEIMVDNSKLRLEFAMYPPNLSTVIKFEYRGINYVVDDRSFPVKIIREQLFINNIIETPNQHH